MKDNKRIGLAFSGGGYRAAAYHLGTMKKLHDLDVLNKVDVLSTISGGSITGAAYCLHKGTFEEFLDNQRKILSRKSIIRSVLTNWKFACVTVPIAFTLLFGLSLTFTKYSSWSIATIILPILILIRYQFRIIPISEYIEHAYNRFFFNGANLEDLCDKPELAIGSTNLQTCRHFTFSKRKMEDSVYAYMTPPILFNGSKFPIARAVMASSSVPFAFTPISIGIEYFRDEKMFDKVNPKLVDGGVYDNQGIHKITQKNSSYTCDYIIVSDAGNKLPFSKSYNNTFTLLLRTVETFMTRIKNFQMMTNLYDGIRDKDIAYHSLGWEVEECILGFVSAMKNKNVSIEVCKIHELPDEWVMNPEPFESQIIQHLSFICKLNNIISKLPSPQLVAQARNVKTNLTPLTKEQINALISIAEALTEIQIRLYLPMLIH